MLDYARKQAEENPITPDTIVGRFSVEQFTDGSKQKRTRSRRTPFGVRRGAHVQCSKQAEENPITPDTSQT